VRVTVIEREMHYEYTDGQQTLRVVTEFGVSKDGALFGIIANVNGLKEGPLVGEPFAVQFRRQGDSLIVEGLKGTPFTPELAQILQGEFRRRRAS
jgi:hypothetical protein